MIAERGELRSRRLASQLQLPSDLQAHEPPEASGLARDGVRLLVSDRRSEIVEHHAFASLPSLLRPGDLLVVNDSATLPAAIDTQGLGETPVTLHCSTQIAGSLWIVEPRDGIAGGSHPLPEPVRSAVAGAVLRLHGGGAATLLTPVERSSSRLWYARLDFGSRETIEYLRAYGRPIHYGYSGEFGIKAYQTIFARVTGSAEMPSAGRPFTSRILRAIEARGVAVATLTLHAGVSSQESHEPPFAERFNVPPVTAAAIARTKVSGGRVVAVGTTVVRALETAVNEGQVIASGGWTERLVTPGRPPVIVDGLLTGLHEPQASHLAMISAFLPEPALSQAYVAAIAQRYLWHEFGDLHLIV